MTIFSGEGIGALLAGYGAYDLAVMSDAPKAYWILDRKTPTFYGEYDDEVKADTPKAYWPLDSVDTV